MFVFLFLTVFRSFLLYGKHYHQRHRAAHKMSNLKKNVYKHYWAPEPDEVPYSLADHAFSQHVNIFHHRGLMDAKAARDRLELPAAAELVHCYIATRISKGIAGARILKYSFIPRRRNSCSTTLSHQYRLRTSVFLLVPGKDAHWTQERPRASGALALAFCK